jgi:hypothetical protein
MLCHPELVGRQGSFFKSLCRSIRKPGASHFLSLDNEKGINSGIYTSISFQRHCSYC